MISFSKLLKGLQLKQVAALVFLLLLFAVGGVPGYLTGYWSWKQPPRIISLKELKNIRQVGLSLPGWQTLKHKEQPIGEHNWSYQEIQKEGSSIQARLLLSPQNGSTDQPELEWTDVNLWGGWKVAQYRIAEFTVKPTAKLGTNTEVKVKARFFRAFTPEQTFAVLQWYAIPTGGDPSPLSWFFEDQLAQWHKSRVPWVGVSILMPMEPLGDVEKSWSLVQSLGEVVQTTLMASHLVP